jgi:putative transcriptional regulator
MMGLMAERSLGGRLLVATPLLGDPNFRRTVVLIVDDQHGDGTLGVVLNRPTEVPVGQVLEPWTDLVTGPSVVFRGGPVQPDSALALALATGEAEPMGWKSLSVAPVMRRIGLVDLEAPPELLAPGVSSFRVFAGYAGWGPGQLQGEIDEGAWYVLRGEPADAFAADPGKLWRTVLRRQGGELAMVATYPDDPSAN